MLHNKATNIGLKLKDIINRKPKTFIALAAVVSIFAYAPFSIWAIMILSFVLFNYLLNNAKTNKAKLGYFTLFTYLFNVVNLHWVGNSFLYGAPDPSLIYFMPLLVAGMALLLTVIYIVLFVIFNKITQDGIVKQIFLIPTVFLIAEFIRSLSVYGFPWNLVGYSIASNDYLLQASELGTVLVCSFLVLIIATLISTFKKKALIAAAVIFVVWFIAGAIRFETIDRTSATDLALETKLIQVDIVKHHGFDRVRMKKIFFKYLAQVQAAKKDPTIKTIILPEMAVLYPINTEENLLKLLQKNIRDDQILITGAPAYNDYDVYNTMYYISKVGYRRYDKMMLVPFGEFIPFRDVLPLVKNFTNNFKDFSVGNIDNTVSIANKNFLSLICYEAIFPFFVKEKLHKDNTILLNITNDAWFYGTVAPAQHALIAKTRAVENNLDMIRVANAGTSFVY
jgi:apolipoprotein N-acyltransferase